MKLINGLACTCLLLLTNCVNGIGYHHRYHLEVRNIGTEQVLECGVSSAKGFFYYPGILSPKKGKTILGPFKFPYADRWTVTWKTADGTTMTKDLDLTKAFPKRFEGRLVLAIDAKNELGYFTEPFDGERAR
jgi:hypothetical protein